MIPLVQPFWREEPFNSDEMTLLTAFFLAHYKSSFRNNVSSVTLRNAMAGSGDFSKAVAAAILTTGDKHAPIKETIWFLIRTQNDTSHIENYIIPEEKIPGWGNSFVKNGPDPLWEDVDKLIRKFHPKLGKLLTIVTDALAEHGKNVFPNPSAYTACVALALDMPPELASYLFIAGRLAAWGTLAWNCLRE